MSDKSTFYLVREEILPEAIKKTIKVKEILKRGEIKTINVLITNIKIMYSHFMKPAKRKLLPYPCCLNIKLVSFPEF